MKYKKTVRKTKKTEVIEPVEPCMCRVHILMDATRKDALPCIGHGLGCPCTEKIQQDAINQQTASVETPTPPVATS